MGWYKLLIIDLPLFVAATLTVIVFFACSQKEICKNWGERALFIPLAIALSIGLCVNNTRAVLEGIFNHETEFLRTPKYRIETTRDTWKEKKYKGKGGTLPIIEMSLGVYFTITIIVASIKKNYMAIPFLIPFQLGFLYVSSMSILQEYGIWPISLSRRKN
jgi:general stress protein CsbA